MRESEREKVSWGEREGAKRDTEGMRKREIDR